MISRLHRYLLAIGFFLFLSQPLTVLAADNEPFTIYFFWGNGCPHCEEEKKLLPALRTEYPGLSIREYEVWYNPTNAAYLQKVGDYFNIPNNQRGVPVTIIGDFPPVIGYGTEETTGAAIREQLDACYANGCPDPGPDLGLKDASEATPLGSASERATRAATQTPENDRTAELPMIGKLDAQKTGLFFFTVIFGIIDGFNACAMWVLCFLLSLLIYTHSRKRLFTIGGTYIFISGFMYFLFIAGWLNLFRFAGYLKPVQVGIALLAIGFGIVSIKDFFWFGKGVSFKIPDRFKPKLYEKMRSTVRGDVSLPAAMLTAALLAIGVNFIELLCTLGLPAVYTSILSTYDYPWIVNFFYLFVYILFYMLDDLIIFSVVVLTMSSKKFTEKYGRISKLISGLIILALGIIMLIDPSLLTFS
ncbi:MAG TPA: hypothetical protein PKL83_04365 [bacterium]|nr:hypothetical protein [bacterium]